MFEEKYRKYYQNSTPSDALNEETLALMMEARDHRAAEPKKTLRWKPAVWIPIAGTAVAAAAALVIVGAWTRGDTYEDLAGNPEDAFSNSISGTDIPDEESTGASPGGDAQATPDDSLADQMAPEENKSNSSTPPADENKSENPSGNTAPNGSSSSEDEPEADGEGSEPEPEGGNAGGSSSDAPSSTPPSPPDPYAPVVSTEKKTATYLSIRDFLDALAKKETAGYGSKYYNARELIIVPSLLPDGARFRHLHLNTENGKYSYSYLFTNEGKPYIIDIEVNAKTPKTLRDLNLQKQAIAEEEILTGKKENHLYYLFGKEDEVTVTLTAPESNTVPTEEEVATLLAQFKLERCSLVNTVIDMKY